MNLIFRTKVLGLKPLIAEFQEFFCPGKLFKFDPYSDNRDEMFEAYSIYNPIHDEEKLIFTIREAKTHHDLDKKYFMTFNKAPAADNEEGFFVPENFITDDFTQTLENLIREWKLKFKDTDIKRLKWVDLPEGYFTKLY